MSLPTPAIEKLEQARLFAEHASELAQLEDAGWRFGLTDAGVFVVDRPGDWKAGRRYDSDLGNLIHRCQPRQPRSKGATTDV